MDIKTKEILNTKKYNQCALYMDGGLCRGNDQRCCQQIDSSVCLSYQNIFDKGFVHGFTCAEAKRVPNRKLTISELQKMNGQKVYVIAWFRMNRVKGWYTVKVTGKGVTFQEHPELFQGNYAGGWMAYLRRPTWKDLPQGEGWEEEEVDC